MCGIRSTRGKQGHQRPCGAVLWPLLDRGWSEICVLFRFWSVPASDLVYDPATAAGSAFPSEQGAPGRGWGAAPQHRGACEEQLARGRLELPLLPRVTVVSHRETVMSKLSSCCRRSADVSYKYSKVMSCLRLAPRSSELWTLFCAASDDRKTLLTGNLRKEKHHLPLLLPLTHFCLCF